MASNMKKVHLTIAIEQEQSIDDGTYMQLVRTLIGQIKNLDVESVRLGRNQVSPSPGSKGDPLTITTLVVIALQSEVPAILAFLQAWSLRNKDRIVKVHIQEGDQSVEVEYPAKMSPDEVRKHIEGVRDTLGKNKKHR